jgi:hypothetical protein
MRFWKKYNLDGGMNMLKKDSAIGVFLCDCGGKISDKIDFSQLTNFR